MRTPALSPISKELLIKEIDNELEELCKKKNNSILRQTKAEELVDFQMAKLIQEIKEKNSPTQPNPAEYLFLKQQEKSPRCLSGSKCQGNHHSYHPTSKVS